MKNKGVFIAFEGPEGGGKSTQIKRLLLHLKEIGKSAELYREPGGTEVSEAIRKVILDSKLKKMIPETELLLYLAARAQIVREKILPALDKGKVVILDRFEDSTFAYQGFGRGLPVKEIQAVSKTWVRGDLRPDLVIVLDIDPKIGLKRGGRFDRMEKQTLSFHRRVRNGFLELAKDRKRYLIVDATKNKNEVFGEILKGVKRVI